MCAKKISTLNSKVKNSSKRPQVYDYHDYRAFLKDWLVFQKASQSNFSLRMLSSHAGLTAGFLPLVLSGKRPLSKNAFSKLVPLLGLDPSESSFLEILITLGNTDSQEVRLQSLRQMKRFGAYQKNNSKETEVYLYLTHWYYVVIREMAALPGFHLDAEWIQLHLHDLVALKEIREAIAFLTENHYIELCADGSIQPPQKDLNCHGGVYRIALTQFHREMLELAVKSMESTPSSARSIVGHTVAIKSENFEKANAIIDDALNKIRALGEQENDPDTVYHLEMALFPLTRRIKK